jgi:hypothetical protein
LQEAGGEVMKGVPIAVVLEITGLGVEIMGDRKVRDTRMNSAYRAGGGFITKP